MGRHKHAGHLSAIGVLNVNTGGRGHHCACKPNGRGQRGIDRPDREAGHENHYDPRRAPQRQGQIWRQFCVWCHYARFLMTAEGPEASMSRCASSDVMSSLHLARNLFAMRRAAKSGWESDVSVLSAKGLL